MTYTGRKDNLRQSPRYESRCWRPVRLGARRAGVARGGLEMGRRGVLDGPMRLQVHRYLLRCHLLPLLLLPHLLHLLHLPHSVDEFFHLLRPCLSSLFCIPYRLLFLWARGTLHETPNLCRERAFIICSDQYAASSSAIFCAFFPPNFFFFH